MRKLFLFLVISVFSGIIFFNRVNADENKSNVFSLGEILVTGEKIQAPVPYSVSEIYLDEFANFQPRSVGEIMDSIEGVDIKYGGKNQLYIYIRGYEQQAVKVLIDGVPMHEPYFGLIDLSMIPIDSIAKIQVIKGASSVLYGANTMAGIVNIITKKYAGGLKNNAEISFGTNGLKNYKYNRSDKIGKFDYFVSLSTVRFDGYRLSSDFDPANTLTGLTSSYRENGGSRNNSWYENNNLGLKFGYKVSDKTQLYLLANFVDAERGCPIEANRAWTFNKWKQWDISFINTHKINDKINLKFQTFYVDHTDELEDDTALTVVAYNSKSWFDKSKYEDYSIGVNALSDIVINENNKLSLGLNYLKDNNHQFEVNTKKGNGSLEFPALKNKWRDAGEYVSNLYSAALEYQFNINKLRLQSGISYDYFEPESSENDTLTQKTLGTKSPESTDEVNSMLSATYLFSDNFNVFAGISKKSRFPRLKELYSVHAGGNPELKTEKTTATELGVNYARNKLKTNASIFYDNMKDYIQTNANKEYENAGKTKIKGFESSASYFLNEKDYLKINYTYLSIKNKITGQILTGRPKHKFYAGVSKRIWYDINTFSYINYTGEQYLSTGKIGGFTLYNLNLSKQFQLKEKADFELFLNVKNIFDKNYTEGSGPGEGRSILGGVKALF
ncbi:MAG TPA: TonB-dependent receptor [bacterium]|nr:TonB-dependent receptor [bacterium]